MSSGREHAAASLGLALISLVEKRSVEDHLTGSTGYVLSLFISPDLDQGTSYYGGRLIRSASPLFFHVWMLFWRPYSILIPHRSWISHFPIIGTVIRIIYLTLPLLLFMESWKSLVELYQWILTSQLFWALIKADLLHFLMDFYDPD